MWSVHAVLPVALCCFVLVSKVTSGQGSVSSVCRQMAQATCAAAHSVCDNVDQTFSSSSSSSPSSSSGQGSSQAGNKPVQPTTGSPTPYRPSLDFSGLRKQPGSNLSTMGTSQSLTKARDAAQAFNRFSSKLYDTLAKEKPAENLFFSPLSIATVMSMVSLGANGNTKDEMETVLSLKTLPEKNAGLQALNGILFGEERTYILRAANRLFANPSYSFRTAYLRLCQSIFNASLRGVDFRNPVAAANIVNRFVEEQTQSKIKNLLPPSLINQNTVMVLVNAIYFKGTWKRQFDERATELKIWYQPVSGSRAFVEKSTKMMYQRGSFNYKFSRELNSRILEVPYSGDASMFIILPEVFDGYLEVEKKLSLPGGVNQALSGLTNSTLDVHLPKFTLKNMKVNLKRPLNAMGMVDVFERSRADLSGIAIQANGLYISAALHEAFIAVDEKGTEAAAATAAVASTRSMLAYPLFNADHPFIFLIREKTTGAILFMGRLVDPTGSSV